MKKYESASVFSQILDLRESLVLTVSPIFLCSVFPLHPAPTGHPPLHSSAAVALHGGAAHLFRPRLHHGGAGPLLQSQHQIRQESGSLGWQGCIRGDPQVNKSTHLLAARVVVVGLESAKFLVKASERESV